MARQRSGIGRLLSSRGIFGAVMQVWRGMRGQDLVDWMGQRWPSYRGQTISRGAGIIEGSVDAAKQLGTTLPTDVVPDYAIPISPVSDAPYEIDVDLEWPGKEPDDHKGGFHFRIRMHQGFSRAEFDAEVERAFWARLRSGDSPPINPPDSFAGVKIIPRAFHREV